MISAVKTGIVMVKAHNANSGVIYVGKSTVNATLDGGNFTCGYALAADQETPWLIVDDDDLQNVYIDGDSSDDNVTFLYEA